VLIASSLFAQTRSEVLKMWENPKPYLEAIDDGIKKREDPSLEDDSKLGDQIRGLAYAINQEIIHAESKDWSNPSPARIKVIQKWGETLEPYTKELLALAMQERKTRYDSSTQARSILDFAAPSEAFASEVREYMSVKNPNFVGEAANLLFEHRLLSESDKDIMRQLMSLAKNENEKIRYAQDIQKYAITDWNELLIDNAKKILEAKPKSNNSDDVINFYGSAIKTASLLKTKAQELSPLLNTLVDYMEKNCPNQLRNAEYARDAVIGLVAEDYQEAKNGSGPLTVKIGDLPQQKIQDDPSKRDSSLERPEKRHSSAASKLSDVTAKKTASWPWGIIASFIVLLVVTLVAWLKARKAKFTS
jgi:hypothetical protein